MFCASVVRCSESLQPGVSHAVMDGCLTLDRLVLHAAALLCFIAPCAAGHGVKTERACLRREDIFDLSCLSIRGWESGMCFLLGFSPAGLRWLEHMLGLSGRLLFWFAPAGDGMEPAWSPSIGAPADPSEPRSSPEMRRHGADLLFRGYSSPVDKKTIELWRWSSQGWSGAVHDGRSVQTEMERQLRQTDRNVWSFWLLQATSCSSDRFYVAMKNRYLSAVCSQGCCYSLRYLQKAQGQRWALSSERIIVLRCAARVSVKNETDAVSKMQIFVQKSRFSVQYSHSERIKYSCDTLTRPTVCINQKFYGLKKQLRAHVAQHNTTRLRKWKISVKTVNTARLFCCGRFNFRSCNDFWVLIRIYCTFSESKLKTAAAEIKLRTFQSHISTGGEYLILKTAYKRIHICNFFFSVLIEAFCLAVHRSLCRTSTHELLI